MPHNADFSKFTDIKEIRVNPDGWISPIIVEYGIGVYGVTPSYFWRVKGTKHTFTIPVVRLEYLSAGDYVQHFKEALEGFRKDYIYWRDSGFGLSWQREYREQYKDFII